VYTFMCVIAKKRGKNVFFEAFFGLKPHIFE
jgi:hypothetical protein